MHKSLKHIAIIYLLFTIVFASGGVKVYTSYCACKQMISFSLSTPDECCTTHSHDHCNTHDDDGDETNESPSNCCNEASIFIKIVDSFIHASSIVVANESFIVLFFNSFSLFVDDTSQSTDQPDVFPLIKPLLHGKDILCFLQSYKIPAC